jgi:putative membrane protein
MGIGMLLFWGLIIAAIVMLVRGLGARTGASDLGAAARTPLDILRERYARGEIERTEFENRRRDLTAS